MKSSISQIVCQLPKGSILGPKPFNIYINDICNTSDLLKLVLFPDDTNIFYSHQNINVLNQKNNELQNLIHGLQLINYN